MKHNYAVLAVLGLSLLSLTGAGAQTSLNPSANVPISLAAQTVTSAKVSTQTIAGQPSYTVNFSKSSWPGITFQPASPWNWSGYDGLAIDLTNATAADETVEIRLDDVLTMAPTDSISVGALVKAGQTKHVVVPFSSAFPAETNINGMRCAPPWFPAFSNVGWFNKTTFNTAHVYKLWLFMDHPKTSQILTAGNFRVVKATPAVTLFSSFVDGYGQFNLMDWPGKIHTDADIASAETAEEQDLANTPPASAAWDSYGGWAAGPTLTKPATFQVAQSNGKWWFVDPLGHLFYCTGIDNVSNDPSTIVTNRTAMFTALPPATGSDYSQFYGTDTTNQTYNFYGANLYRRFGASYAQSWQDRAVQRMKSWGFNTCGAWSDWTLVDSHQLPYMILLSTAGTYNAISTGNNYWGLMPDPYDPAFTTAAAANFAANTYHKQTDPWLVGYFVDNELDWTGVGTNANDGIIIGAMSQNTSWSPAKTAMLAQLQAEYGTIASLNTAWQTSFSSWMAMNAGFHVAATLTSAQAKDFSSLLSAFAKQYFSVVSKQLKLADPNHLYLGCRFSGIPQPEVLAAAAKYADVVSCNLYQNSVDSGTAASLASTGKPCLISEFHFGSNDSGLFWPGVVGVDDQALRASSFTTYAASALQCPSVVGYQWFQYTDEPVTGRSDDENGNIGWVDVSDTPYPDLVGAARSLQGGMYPARY